MWSEVLGASSGVLNRKRMREDDLGPILSAIQALGAKIDGLVTRQGGNPNHSETITKTHCYLESSTSFTDIQKAHILLEVVKDPMVALAVPEVDSFCNAFF